MEIKVLSLLNYIFKINYDINILRFIFHQSLQKSLI